MAHNSLESVIKLDVSNTLPSSALREFNGHKCVHISLLHKRSFSRSCAIINHFKVFSCKEWLWHWKLCFVNPFEVLWLQVMLHKEVETIEYMGLWIVQCLCCIADDVTIIRFGESLTKLMRLKCELKEVAHYWHILLTGSYSALLLAMSLRRRRWNFTNTRTNPTHRLLIVGDAPSNVIARQSFSSMSWRTRLSITSIHSIKPK